MRLGQTFDSRGVIETINDFEGDNEELLEQLEEHPDCAAALLALVNCDDYEEYAAAKEIEATCSDCSEWDDGVQFIRDDYFEEYAKELVVDIGDMLKDIPSYIEIDWAATAANIQQDYSSYEISGDTYWVR